MSKCSELFIKLLYISVFCLPGVILRVFLFNQSKKHEIFPQNSYFLPNFVGSFIMGIGQLPALKEQFPLLHLGITVGFCGSLTTFSSWLVGALIKQEPKYIAVDIVCGILLPLIAVLAGKHLVIFSAKQFKRSTSDGTHVIHQRRMSETIAIMANPVVVNAQQDNKPCLQSGKQLINSEQSSQPSEEEESGEDQEKIQQGIVCRQSLVLSRQNQKEELPDKVKSMENQNPHQQLHLQEQRENLLPDQTQSQQQRHQIKSNKEKNLITILGLVLVFVILISLLIIDQVFNQGNVYVYEALLGPPGAVIRFFLCDKLNSKIKTFQLGTFGSNLLGCIVAFVLQVTCIKKMICSEVQVGMMGSLTTVSSWANDTIGNIKTSYVKAAFYNLTTFIVCAGIGAAIMEPYR